MIWIERVAAWGRRSGPLADYVGVGIGCDEIDAGKGYQGREAIPEGPELRVGVVLRNISERQPT